MSTRDLLRRLMVLALVAGASVACTGRAGLIPGTPAPTFSLPAARGGAGQLRDGSGRVVLLAFLNTQAPAAPATSDPSRAQLPFLKSMREQYGDALRVLIVDASALAAGGRPGQGDLLNFTYDWQLDDVPVLDDARGALARSYAVDSLPTTFLIDGSGTIRNRWNDFVSAADLALAIEALVGPPAQRR